LREAFLVNGSRQKGGRLENLSTALLPTTIGIATKNLGNSNKKRLEEISSSLFLWYTNSLNAISN
jgi:hypothetical protein